LGIDYGIYRVARYLQLRRNMESTGEALVATTATTGPGVLTSALTSAIAFFAAGLTEFPGVAQLGLLAGGGVLLCWLAESTVLPAMIGCSTPTAFGRSAYAFELAVLAASAVRFPASFVDRGRGGDGGLGGRPLPSSLRLQPAESPTRGTGEVDLETNCSARRTAARGLPSRWRTPPTKCGRGKKRSPYAIGRSRRRGGDGHTGRRRAEASAD